MVFVLPVMVERLPSDRADSPLNLGSTTIAAKPLLGRCCIALCKFTTGVLIMEWLWKKLTLYILHV
ncbi:MAG: hypothetical protein KME42_02900 [Tildeniella nuda ZEHNDER 1965/U140]|nr:hypothetical protein [Tildeniella nuda ZEHNDER 1965/U140]